MPPEAGTDAAKLARLSPPGEAKRRIPWLLGTMLIELGSAAVVAHFHAVLEQAILLAAFMPVISAVAGNVGLQAAAITVRALDTGFASLRHISGHLARELTTTVLIALVCGATLGAIAVIWSGKMVFGAVVGLALGCSMFTAAIMGSIIPMISKRLGFDPATTAGPFETAVQDVVGFAVFLALASLFIGAVS